MKSTLQGLGFVFLIVVILAVLLLTQGCVLTPSYDPISEQHAAEARDTIHKYTDPALPQSAQDVLKGQADEWLEHERSKR